MPAIESVEIWSGRTASHDMGNVRSYKRTFRVTTNNMQDGPLQLAAVITGLPTLFTPYVDSYGSIDPGALCQSYRPRQTEDPFTWEIDVEYSSALIHVGSPAERGRSGRTGKAEQANRGSEDQNPLNRPPVIRFSNPKFQSEVQIDVVTRKAIANSAGDAFEPPPIADKTRLVATYDRNEASLRLGDLTTYQDVLNNDIFWGSLPLTWKLNLAAESAFENGLFYWRKTYTLEYRLELDAGDGVTVIGWDQQGIDRGYNYLDQSLTSHSILDPHTGIGYANPQNLDGSGSVLGPGKKGLPTPPFAVYKRAAFAPLQLQLPIQP